MSIPKGKTQLPPSLRNWCKPINSRHCKYASSSNFILSAVLSELHCIGSHNAMLGPFGAMLDVVFIITVLTCRIRSVCTAFVPYVPHWIVIALHWIFSSIATPAFNLINYSPQLQHHWRLSCTLRLRLGMQGVKLSYKSYKILYFWNCPIKSYIFSKCPIKPIFSTKF